MFEAEILAGSAERSIRVDTHRGTPIPNVIAPPADEAAKRWYDGVRKRFGKQWKNRKPATGVYNCYGMIFASRRTSIDDDENDTIIHRILEEDGYRQLSSQVDVAPGDIVLYRLSGSNEIVHMAMVTRRDSLVDTDGQSVAKVGGACYALSKWGPQGGEDEHHIERHCWTEHGISKEYWTDRAEL